MGRATGVAAFMRNVWWAWPAAECLHFLALAALAGTIGVFDLRLLGVAKAIQIRSLHRLVPAGAAAFAVSAATGSLFLMTAPDQYLFNPAFKLKLGCMAIAGVNVLVFYGAYGRSLNGPGPPVEPGWPIKAIAGLSLASWAGVVIFGRLITLFRPPAYLCIFCG